MALLTENPLVTDKFTTRDARNAVVVAGPGSSLTIPGLIVSEIAQALAKRSPVTRIEVDLNADFLTGLHRAPSLAAAHRSIEDRTVHHYQASTNLRQRAQTFRKLIGPEVATAIAYAWPGIDNAWIKQFIHASRSAGALTVVACASLPQPSHARAIRLARTFAYADVVLVGDEIQARELSAVFGRYGPLVESHHALSLEGRSGRRAKKQITAFLPQDDAASLATLMSAFDAIPEAWIDAYDLQVVMRFRDPVVPKLVSSSYHANHVQLIGDKISSPDLQALCSASSALSIAAPVVNSPMFSMAVKSGISTVVLGNSSRPEVGRGYVGGLIADRSRTTSVHVALIHALRLAELQFPDPGMWDQFAQRIGGVREQAHFKNQSVVGTL